MAKLEEMRGGSGCDHAGRVIAGLPQWYSRQQDIVDMLDAGLRFLVLFWARQTGKTTLCAALAARWLAEGKTGAYFAWTTQYVDEVFEEIVTYLGGESGPVITKCDRNKMVIRTATGGYLKVWSLKNNAADAGRGARNHFVIYEEAGLIPRLIHHFRNTIVGTVGTHEGVVLFNGNAKPRGDLNTLYHKGLEGAPGWAATRVQSHENPHGISYAELQRIKAEYEADGVLSLYRQEYEAVPMEDIGSPYYMFSELVAPISILPPRGMGWDIGEMLDQTIGAGIDDAGDLCRLVNAKLKGAQDLDDIAEVIYRETGDVEACVDATGVGKGPYETLEKRALREGLVRTHLGRADVAPAGGVAPKIIDGKRSIYEGVIFTGPRRQELYGGVRTWGLTQAGHVPDGPLLEALLSAEFVMNDRTGEVTIQVPRGIHKDHVDAYALGIRAWHRADRGPEVPIRARTIHAGPAGGGEAFGWG